MYTVGRLSALYKEFYNRKQAENYKQYLIDNYDFDPDYIRIYYFEEAQK